MIGQNCPKPPVAFLLSSLIDFSGTASSVLERGPMMCRLHRYYQNSGLRHRKIRRVQAEILPPKSRPTLLYRSASCHYNHLATASTPDVPYRPSELGPYTAFDRLVHISFRAIPCWTVIWVRYRIYLGDKGGRWVDNGD